MYLLQRFSSLANIQPNTDTPESLLGVFTNSTNRSRNHTRRTRPTHSRHPTLSLSLPAKKASATVSLSNAIVSAECIAVGNGGLSTLELRLPYGVQAQKTEPAPPSSVPFPSSAPKSLSYPCSSKFDFDSDEDIDCDFGPFSSPDTPLLSRDVESDPEPCHGRKRAKSCLSLPSCVDTFADDALAFMAGADACGYGSDTETTARSAQIPLRKRRLAHSTSSAAGASVNVTNILSLKRGAFKKPSKPSSNAKRSTRRAGAGAVDVHFVALMHRSISFHLQLQRTTTRTWEDGSHSRSSSGGSTASNVSNSEAYTGIANEKDGDVRMDELCDGDKEIDDANVFECQDRILVSRLARILADQGQPVAGLGVNIGRECSLSVRLDSAF